MTSNWIKCELQEVADLTVGYVGTMADEYVDEGVPFLRSLNIEPYFINSNDMKYISENFSLKLKKSQLQKGDVVIVRTGKPGTCAVVPEALDGANCSDLVIVRPYKNIINPFFLSAYINVMANNQIYSNLVGAVQQHFNVTSAKKLVLTIPSINEQNKVAQFLKNINKKIFLNDKAASELKKVVVSLFESYFYKPRYNANEEKSENVFDNITEIKEKNVEQKNYPVLSVVKEGEFKASEDVFTKQVYSKSTKNYKIVRRNQVAYNPARANIGSIAMLKEYDIGLVSPIYTVFELKDTITPTFFYYYMKQPIFQEMIKHHAIGTTRQNFPFEAFKMFPMVVPPMELQLKFEEIAKPIEQKIAKLKEENEVLAEIRDTLLPKLMSGELPVEVGEK